VSVTKFADFPHVLYQTECRDVCDTVRDKFATNPFVSRVFRGHVTDFVASRWFVFATFRIYVGNFHQNFVTS